MTELERMELRFEWYGEEGETLAYKTARNIDIGDTISLEPAIPRIDIKGVGAGVTVKGLRIIISSQPEYKPSPPFKLSDKVIQLAREHYNKVAPYIGRHILRAVGVNNWEQLEGKSCWAYFDKKNGKITAIEAPDFVEHKGRFDLNNETCARGYHVSEISYEICQVCQEHTNKNCFVNQQEDSIRKLRGIS